MLSWTRQDSMDVMRAEIFHAYYNHLIGFQMSPMACAAPGLSTASSILSATQGTEVL